MNLFDRMELYDWLAGQDLAEWSTALGRICAERFASEFHGTLPNWSEAWQSLPYPEQSRLDASGAVVAVRGELKTPEVADESLKQTLMQFHPWRKGPFQFLGIDIDTEWRSDLKWNRIGEAVDWRGKKVLDVGCGNGYYGWRMLDAGADFVLGCDPLTLYLMQFEVFRRYAGQPNRHFIVPLMDFELPSDLRIFDITVSMGVLYHRTSPIEHLQKLHSTLKPGGKVLLETLVVEKSEFDVLMPEDRYAKMRNVWFIPSIPMLERWLMRTGFRDIRVIDVSKTTDQEQRKTEWMTYESLADFLNPSDSSQTVEGYPAPRRAIVTAKRK